MLKDEGTMFFQTRFAFCPDHVEWINRMATALIALYYSSTMRRTVIPIGRRPCLVFLMRWFCQELGPDGAWGGGGVCQELGPDSGGFGWGVCQHLLTP